MWNQGVRELSDGGDGEDCGGPHGAVFPGSVGDVGGVVVIGW